MKFLIVILTLLFTMVAGAQSSSKTLTIGPKTNDNKVLKFNRNSSTPPQIRWSESATKLQFTNDGSNFSDLGSGSGGGGSGTNLLSDFNFNFELASPPANWTASGGTFVSDTTTEMFDEQSGVWDSSASGQTLCSQAATIVRGMIGQKCQAQIFYRWPSGVANDIKMVVKDTGVDVGQVNLTPTNSNDVTSAFLTYDCPDTATDTLQLCLESTVTNPAEITVDNAFLGSGNQTITEKPQDVYSVYIANSGTPTVTNTNFDWITSLTDNGTGDVTINFKTGVFTQAPNCNCTAGHTAAAILCQLDKTTTPSATSMRFNAFTTGGAAADRDLMVTCQKVESSANRSAITLETASQSWAGYHDSTCSWARTNTAYGDPTADATCGFTERSNTGFGTVTSALSGSDKLPGIVFTPKLTGKYFVTVNVNDVNCASTNADYGIQLVDGSGTVVGNATGDCGAGGTEGAQLSINGIYSGTAGTAVTLKIQSKIAGGVTITIPKNVNDTVLNWSIFRIDQAFPTPVFSELTNLVKAENGAMKIAAAKITAGVCSVSPCSPLTGVEGISSITRSVTGTYVVNFDASYFSDATSIVCHYNDQFNLGLNGAFSSYAASSVALVTRNNGGTATDSAMGVFCIGK